MAPGIRSLTAAVSLTGALLLTPLPYAAAVGDPPSGPSVSPSTTAGPSLSPSSSSSSSPSASSSSSPDPSGTPSSRVSSEEQHLAGSRAGVGRTRPGRVDAQYPSVPDAPDEIASALNEAQPRPAERTPAPEPSQPGSPQASIPTAPQPPARHRQSPRALSTESDLRFHVLSLGAGLTLTGLGLGFLGLRLRRL
ncbi:hypothetical protein ACGFW5_29465 [Streptomyces sp. NPDC048416]|uniref:hypothetical protein n=1 Tax=Streptomyces sp. NPDC048416 TaxID=3365546 RepID=UPI00371C31D0